MKITYRIKDTMPFLRGLLISSSLVVGILVLFRLIFIALNVPIQVICDQCGDLTMTVYNALRFDMQVAAYVALLPTVIMLAQAFIASAHTKMWLKQFCSWYYAIAIILISLLSAIDLGYYANFNSHISITFFDFFDEEPLSLVQTIWDDYPVVWIAIGLCVVGFICKIISNKAYSHVGKPCKISPKGISCRLVGYVVILAICLRGSLGMYPLQVEDLVVSADERINNIIPNAPYMLKKALKEKSVVFDTKSTDALLKEYSFASLKEAMDTFNDADNALTADTLASLRKVLFSHAADTMKHLQPNILLLCSESWSNYLLHQKPLQCGMEKHLAQDIFFSNYQSVRNGTVATIENITVSTPYPRVFRSKYRKDCLPSAITLPFRNSGYTCEFISGMDLAWENCGIALKKQKFDKLPGKFDILKEIPKAEYNGIGVYDEYMLDVILNHLNRDTKHPQMIMGMTTTNHPPLDLPSNVKLPALPKDYCKQACFSNVGEDVVMKYLRAFQYYDKNLAAFLDKFKKSKAADNTILVITGDHNVRSILDYNTVDKKWKNSVPLYVYLPPYLRSNNYPLYSKKYGCHYDILATLAPFAFKGTDYMKLGNNLLDTTVPDDRSYSYNEEQTLAAPNYLKKAERKAQARELLLRLYFQKTFAKLEKNHKVEATM